jgi:hypothetical protein
MPYPVPLCAISFNPKAGQYGYRIWFDGAPPHDKADVFSSIQDLLCWLDAHQERVWIQVNDFRQRNCHDFAGLQARFFGRNEPGQRPAHCGCQAAASW